MPEYEADHSLPAGPAEPAGHGDTEGLRRLARCLEITEQTSSEPSGKRHQVSQTIATFLRVSPWAGLELNHLYFQDAISSNKQ